MLPRHALSLTHPLQPPHLPKRRNGQAGVVTHAGPGVEARVDTQAGQSFRDAAYFPGHRAAMTAVAVAAAAAAAPASGTSSSSGAGGGSSLT